MIATLTGAMLCCVVSETSKGLGGCGDDDGRVEAETMGGEGGDGDGDDGGGSVFGFKFCLVTSLFGYKFR